MIQDVAQLHKQLEAAGYPVVSVSADGRVEFAETITAEQRTAADAMVRGWKPKTYEEALADVRARREEILDRMLMEREYPEIVARAELDKDKKPKKQKDK